MPPACGRFVKTNEEITLMADSNFHKDGPTVILVHGAFADAGSWAGVTERLLAAGVPMRAIVNPLRGVPVDSAYVASAINQTPAKVQPARRRANELRLLRS